jgi:methylmalonyl-CoA mutase cobalamin-binding subunit
MGIGRLFGPGTDTTAVAEYIREEIGRRRAASR